MHDRRELVLRLIQALGLAWIALAFSFYAFPGLMLGRGISLIALPLALGVDGFAGEFRFTGFWAIRILANAF